jgi:uncharacterized protein involved in copper resistance
MSSLERIIVTAIAAALILPFGACAADEKPAEQTQKTAPAPAPKKATPHSHSEMNKQGAPSAAPDQSAAPKKQGHKHSDWK